MNGPVVNRLLLEKLRAVEQRYEAQRVATVDMERLGATQRRLQFSDEVSIVPTEHKVNMQDNQSDPLLDSVPKAKWCKQCTIF